MVCLHIPFIYSCVCAIVHRPYIFPVYHYCRVVYMDMQDSDSVREAVDEAMPLFGRVDMLINNAGEAASVDPEHFLAFTVNRERFASTKFQIRIFCVQIFWDIYLHAARKFYSNNLLLTCGTSDRESTKRIVYLLSKIFALLIFGYQQAIRKYLNTEDFPIYGICNVITCVASCSGGFRIVRNFRLVQIFAYFEHMQIVQK